ncbi:hypothetical protein PENSTE_c001G09300 [Penicillium steckii]|uniref:Uncharacterized protein n=1 Tax=Penicillium steckii TaxID=303698 RepID=A0A1V6TZ91_9EURO|nr:hypothetical protein PENSTE_c001G09300 [Penicillium steckii]
MAFLEEELGLPAQPPIQKSVVCLWGLTGVGKSQLAAIFVNKQRSSCPNREIFWISTETQESFEQSVLSMLKSGEGVAASETTELSQSSSGERRRLVNFFFSQLNSLDDARWLLVIDGVNGTPHSDKRNSHSSDVHRFVAGLDRGYVLLTSLRRDTIEIYHPIWEVQGLKVEDAVSLFRLKVHPSLMEEGISHTKFPSTITMPAHGFLPDMEELVGLLKGSPLALCLATSVITRYRFTVREYLALWRSHSDASEILGTNKTLCRSLELSFEEIEKSDPIAANILTLFSFLHHRDLWYDICHNANEDTYPTWLQDLAREKKPFRQYCPLLADLSFIELNVSTNGERMWEIHPAVQVVARQRAKSNEQEYIRCAISLVASEVPRSYEANFWGIMRRLKPHIELCWSFVKEGKWGPNTNLDDLESLGRVFRHFGQYDDASLVYRIIERGLSLQADTFDNSEFLANVLTNLGLVYTGQRKFDQALDVFDRSWSLMSKLDILTPNALMSIMYNKAVVFMMTDRLNEAEVLLRNAAAHFSEHRTDEHVLLRNERRDLYFRILNDLGEVSLRSGSVPAAMRIFDHVYDSRKNWEGENHPTFFSLKLNMARALTKFGRFGEARALLLEIITVYTGWWGGTIWRP